MEKLKTMTEAQVNSLHAAAKSGQPTRIARFITGRKAIQLGSGVLTGGNVMYHPVYWKVTPDFAALAISTLKKNNPGRSFTVAYSE